MPKKFGAALLLLQLLFSSAQVIRECPTKCTCDEWLLLRRANCTSVHTHSIFLGVSDDVQAFDLFNNSISKLPNQELMRAGLTQLRYLNLSFNEISEIAVQAFYRLQELAVLDLSRNHLEYLDPDTFLETGKLQILKLNFNKFNVQVPQLRSNSITELGLQGCMINYIPTKTFKDLPKLKILDISNNLMQKIDGQVFKPMTQITTIYLQDNPWFCDLPMRMLRKYFVSRKVDFQRLCESQKFDKMINVLESINSEKLYETLHDREQRMHNSWDSVSKSLEQQKLSALEILWKVGNYSNSTDLPKEITVAKLKDMSPYWLVIIGFLLGSAVTIVVTYLLLSTTISCFHPMNRRCLCDSAVDGVSQRVSLLHNFCQVNGLHPTDPDHRPACPGTPPPPYREVMLHRNLYPNPPRTSSAT